MLVWVPEPVCQTTSGKWSSSLPSITSCAARDDHLGEARLERAELAIGAGGRLLDDAERADQRRRHGLGADPEVLQARCVCAPQ